MLLKRKKKDFSLCFLSFKHFKTKRARQKYDIIQNNNHLLREINQVEKELGISRGGKTKESKLSNASGIRDKKIVTIFLSI